MVIMTDKSKHIWTCIGCGIEFRKRDRTSSPPKYCTDACSRKNRYKNFKHSAESLKLMSENSARPTMGKNLYHHKITKEIKYLTSDEVNSEWVLGRGINKDSDEMLLSCHRDDISVIQCIKDYCESKGKVYNVALTSRLRKLLDEKGIDYISCDQPKLKNNPVRHIKCGHCSKDIRTTIPHKQFCDNTCYLADKTKDQLTINCLVCGKGATTYDENKKYCSRTCYEIIQRTPVVSFVNCGSCGKEFVADRPGRKFCSNECVGLANARPDKYKECKQCKKQFAYRNNSFDKNKQFCGTDCYNDFQRTGKVKKYKFNCAECGEYTEKTYKAKFCSAKCTGDNKRRYQRKNKQSTNAKGHCPNCNRIAPKGKIYCNNKCYREFNKKEVLIFKCKQCKEPFETTKKTREYCSKKCSTKGTAKPIKRVEIPCKFCKTMFMPRDKTKQYCGKECSHKARVKPIPMWDCQGCGIKFPRKITHKLDNPKYCDRTCADKNKKTTKKVVIYKGIKMDSSWEALMAEKLDKDGISWQRGDGLPWVDDKGKQRTYYPDFYLPDYGIYIEVKSHHLQKMFEEQNMKIKYIKKHYKNVIFVYSPKECNAFDISQYPKINM